MKKSDITKRQIDRADMLLKIAVRDLHEEKKGRFKDEYYGFIIRGEIFYGFYWRRIVKIKNLEDARREALDVSKRLVALYKKQKERLQNVKSN